MMLARLKESVQASAVEEKRCLRGAGAAGGQGHLDLDVEADVLRHLRKDLQNHAKSCTYSSGLENDCCANGSVVCNANAWPSCREAESPAAPSASLKSHELTPVQGQHRLQGAPERAWVICRQSRTASLSARCGRRRSHRGRSAAAACSAASTKAEASWREAVAISLLVGL